jgi:hypothetical protein
MPKTIVSGRATVGGEMASMTALSEYVLETLREGADSTLYRGRKQGDPWPVLAVALVAEQPFPSESPAAGARILTRSRPRSRVGSQASGPHSL